MADRILTDEQVDEIREMVMVRGVQAARYPERTYAGVAKKYGISPRYAREVRRPGFYRAKENRKTVDLQNGTTIEEERKDSFLQSFWRFLGRPNLSRSETAPL